MRLRFQSNLARGSANSSTIGFMCNITRYFQMNPALDVNNGPGFDLFGYVVFTYTFHLWNKQKAEEKSFEKKNRLAQA